jgi:hypothetical protein
MAGLRCFAGMGMQVGSEFDHVFSVLPIGFEFDTYFLITLPLIRGLGV